MPTLLAPEARAAGPIRLESALARLRQSANPFGSGVAAAGTAVSALRTDVRSYARHQLADLLKIVSLYRDGRPGTRVYAVLGDPGAGKTHLFYVLSEELRQRALESGEETMLVAIDRLSPQADPVDYLLWQMVNQLLSRRGDGERLLESVAARLTGRLVAESLRRLAPHGQAALVPPKNWWERLGLRFGSRSPVQRRLGAVAEFIDRCDSPNPTGEGIRVACSKAGLPAGAVLEVLKQHLERTESDDPRGWARKAIYGRLAQLSLFADRGPFEDFHNGEYEAAPANVRVSGNVSRWLLDTWLELLHTLSVPVIVVFDQLEAFLNAAEPRQAAANQKQFTQAVTSFIDQVPSVCVIVFAESGLWTELINNMEAYARERLRQPFSLPGQPLRNHIDMPMGVDIGVLAEVVRRRVNGAAPDQDWTGLPPEFPFSESDLERLKDERTIRECLRALARRYDEIVFAPGPAPAYPPNAAASVSAADTGLRDRLAALWTEHLTGAEANCPSGPPFSTSFIPEFQNALDGWLRCLHENCLTGSNPWSGVDLLQVAERRQYGYLNVVRTAGPNDPGVGIAAWLGERAARLTDLQRRLEFFSDNPCPVRTLVLLRADGDSALEGQTGETFREARRSGRNVRVCAYDIGFIHSALAFMPWLQTAVQEAKASEGGPEIFRKYLRELSAGLLQWIDGWHLIDCSERPQ